MITATSILSAVGNTPLVPLVHLAKGLPVPVLAKCEHLNPGGSVKDRIAHAIVNDAVTRGVLKPGATLIEATAGNTGVGLALVAAVRGYRLVCVMPEKMSADKRAALASLGVKVIVTPNAPPHDPRNFQNVARQLAKENNWFLTEQFENPANPHIHETTTAPEIWSQTEGKLAAFVAGAGTGGTLTGVGRFLRSKGSTARVVLADPVGSLLSHFVDPKNPKNDAGYQVEGIGGSVVPKNLDLQVIDEAELVSDEESFAMAGRLWREEGLLVGGSSGTAVTAALRVAARGNLNGPVVVVITDSWDRYTTKPWFQALVNSGGGIESYSGSS